MAQHARFAVGVATQRWPIRLCAKGSEVTGRPRLLVSAATTHSAAPGTARNGTRSGRRGDVGTRTGRDGRICVRAWPSTRYAGRTGRIRRVRRRGESTATRRASRHAVYAKTCGV
jgi:hypothetical protein